MLVELLQLPVNIGLNTIVLVHFLSKKIKVYYAYTIWLRYQTNKPYLVKRPYTIFVRSMEKNEIHSSKEIILPLVLFHYRI